MKNFILKITVSSVFLLLLAFFVGCSLQHGCNNHLNIEFVSWDESSFPHKKHVSIGKNQYLVSYDNSQISANTLAVTDTYLLPLQSGANVKLERDTGRVVSFSNITPFPAIEGAASLSDGELRAIVELYLRKLADFSQYNSFSVSRDDEQTERSIQLHWTYKKDDISYNRDCYVSLNEDGKIYSFDLNESCPTWVSPTFLSEKRQLRILERKICDLVDEPSIRYCHYEIKNKTLTLDGGKPAMIYYFHATDREGFGWLYIMAIS